jgi:hypothetical protein
VEEATEAAWVVVWRKLGNVRDEANLRPWLVSVTANEAKRVLRTRRRIAKRVLENPVIKASSHPEPMLLLSDSVRREPGFERRLPDQLPPSGASRLSWPSKAKSSRSTIRKVSLSGPKEGRQAGLRTMDGRLPSMAR